MRKAPLLITAMVLLAALMLFQTVLPERTSSDMENRVLNTRPVLSLSAMSGSRWADTFEAFCADQMPLRDTFVSIYTSWEAVSGHRVIENVIRGGDQRLFDRTDGWRARNVTLNAGALGDLEDMTGVPSYLLAVPSANAVYPELLPAGAPVADEEALIALAGRETTVIPLLDPLRDARDQGLLYYRTDHHWTDTGAYTGYLAVCEALGLTPLPAPEVTRQPGFCGSFYARCPLPWQQPDTFAYPTVPGIRLVIDGAEQDGLVDPLQLAGRDLYASLLYGNHARMELINDQAPDGPTWFVIKDSYANALLPLLARHCGRIVAVDARYFAEDITEAVLSSKGDIILCIQGVASLASNRTLALLEGL